MEKRIIAFGTEGKDVIYVETEVSESTLELVASGGNNEVLKAVKKFEQSLEPVANLAKSVISSINSAEGNSPNEIELNFAIKLSGNLDFWVISGTGEGNISLSLKWVRP